MPAKFGLVDVPFSINIKKLGMSLGEAMVILLTILMYTSTMVPQWWV